MTGIATQYQSVSPWFRPMITTPTLVSGDRGNFIPGAPNPLAASLALDPSGPGPQGTDVVALAKPPRATSMIEPEALLPGQTEPGGPWGVPSQVETPVGRFPWWVLVVAGAVIGMALK